MRVNTRKAFEAFMGRKAAKPADSIWSDGDRLWSYRTVIAEHQADGSVLLNVRKYSTTTAIHQNALRAAFQQAGVVITEHILPIAA